jgi:AcrR family transcriptional regulator
MPNPTDAPPTRRRPGAHDPEGRRQDVLRAARRLFASHGYAGTSVRAIAAAAEVNQAQVVTYFGGKEALFIEAVGRFEIEQDALAGPLAGIGARIARVYIDRWERMSDDDPWPALIRSSMSHRPSHELLRSELDRQLAIPLGRLLGKTGDGPVRNALVQCLLAGMIMERYIYGLQPARSLPVDAFERGLAAALQHAIAGPLSAPERPR